MSRFGKITFFEKISLIISVIALVASIAPTIISYLDFVDKGPGIRVEFDGSEIVGLSKCCVLGRTRFKLTNLEGEVSLLRNLQVEAKNVGSIMSWGTYIETLEIASRESRVVEVEIFVPLNKSVLGEYRKNLIAEVGFEPNFNELDDFEPIVDDKHIAENFVAAAILGSQIKSGESGVESFAHFSSGFEDGKFSESYECQDFSDSKFDELTVLNNELCMQLRVESADGEVFIFESPVISLETSEIAAVDISMDGPYWIPDSYKEPGP